MTAASCSLQSCPELRVLSIGSHRCAGAHRSFSTLQIEPALLNIITQFLLEPPRLVTDRFMGLLTGPAVELKDGDQTACHRYGVGANWRHELASAGAHAISEGLVKWTVRCSGHSWAIGVISEDRWQDLQKDNSMDWPFVGQGVGQGYGMIARRGSVYISRQSPAKDPWNCNCADDYAVPASDLQGATLFSVVLALDREHVFFEKDGVRINGSVVQLTEHQASYRFIASVPDKTSSVTIIGS